MIEVSFNGAKCVKLPDSEYVVTCEGTPIKVTCLVPYKKRDVFRVTRKGTQKYYTREQLKALYNKYK